MTSTEIKNLRAKLNLTQYEFGKLLGLSRHAVQSIELGRREMGPSARILLKQLEEKTMEKHTIEIAFDSQEGAEFCIWLNKNGHDASIGNTTGNFIDGEWTSTNEYANNILNGLWDDYCRQ